MRYEVVPCPTGWDVCQPRGERTRVHFPTLDEADAYAAKLNEEEED